MPPFIYYPGNEYMKSSNFPFKTFAMLVTFIVILVVSYVTKYLFQNEVLPPSADVLQCRLSKGGRSKSLKDKSIRKKLMETETM